MPLEEVAHSPALHSARGVRLEALRWNTTGRQTVQRRSLTRGLEGTHTETGSGQLRVDEVWETERVRGTQRLEEDPIRQTVPGT